MYRFVTPGIAVFVIAMLVTIMVIGIFQTSP